MRRRSLPAVLAALLAIVAAIDVPAAAGATTTTTYTPASGPIANPDRGFYHYTDDCDKVDFVTSQLVAYRTDEKISLVLCIFYLAQFKTSAISQAQLDRFDRQAARVRAAGLKMVVRFAYTTSTAGDDASPSRVQAHLNQLAPYLQANADVIAVVQSGFVGAWGEGYYTQHFGNAGVVSAANWADRKAVVDKLLAILPVGRKVQVRTPAMKRRMYGTTPATAADAAAGRAVARVGHHNDCFLASSDDLGTYDDPSVEYPYLEADSKYVPVGGETCAANPPRSNCPTALNELGMFHYTYLNRDYAPEVFDSWTAGGCMPEIDRRLGYRFVLTRVTSATTVTRGTDMEFHMTVRNDGWAAAMNARPVRLILRNTSTGALRTLSLTSAATWYAGATVTFTPQHLTIPSSVPAGTYALLLSLPSPSPSLAARPEYAIRLANLSLWEPSTGLNRLGRTVKVL